MIMYSIAQGILLNDYGDLNGKEVQEGGDMCVCSADSFCCTVETNTTLKATICQ